MASKIVFLFLHILSYGLSTYLSLRKERGSAELLNEIPDVVDLGKSQ